MEVLMQLMMVGIFVVVVAAAYKLVKTSKDHSRDESVEKLFCRRFVKKLHVRSVKEMKIKNPFLL